MKQTIKVKVLTDGCAPTISKNGDWIDLRAASTIHMDWPYAFTKLRKSNEGMKKIFFSSTYIPLGVAMQLPPGMEAVMVPRSSSFKNFNILQSNSFGVIDNSYCGPNDQWCMPVIAIDKVKINKGDRICQFKIQPSQKATIWQKLKWLLSSGVKIKVVEELKNQDRKGFGHSGVK